MLKQLSLKKKINLCFLDDKKNNFYIKSSVFLKKKNIFTVNFLNNNAVLWSKSIKSLINVFKGIQVFFFITFSIIFETSFFIIKLKNLFFFKKLTEFFFLKKKVFFFKNFNFFYINFCGKKIKSIKKNLKKKLLLKNSYFFF